MVRLALTVMPVVLVLMLVQLLDVCLHKVIKGALRMLLLPHAMPPLRVLLLVVKVIILVAVVKRLEARQDLEDDSAAARPFLMRASSVLISWASTGVGNGRARARRPREPLIA
uniref:Uncharacterized protein n=1 Tax=Haptolina brevifila TaxID=156173 RepID=A0A7S2C649_9EUKA|mmetsp:Transcript_20914/g.42441  ORF Transcript_20914/g.42441 Transcript_20914/m.42441 type:complete len:113 (+) Transcript_20914:602-940(+)